MTETPLTDDELNDLIVSAMIEPLAKRAVAELRAARAELARETGKNLSLHQEIETATDARTARYVVDMKAAFAERDAALRELERHRHGSTVEGDVVCPDSLALAEARAEVERLRAVAEHWSKFHAKYRQPAGVQIPFWQAVVDSMLNDLRGPTAAPATVCRRSSGEDVSEGASLRAPSAAPVLQDSAGAVAPEQCDECGFESIHSKPCPFRKAAPRCPACGRAEEKS